jgi:drug/metabolite transporter (DMT)-like permease
VNDKGIHLALFAAALFGASTPLAKLLTGSLAPTMLAALLYLGSGIGLSLWMMLRALSTTRADKTTSLAKADLPWLAGAILTGGIAGPVLLLTGLRQIAAAPASLLLNLEGVMTAVLAWVVFREQFDRRIFIGMVLIVAGGVLLSWQGSGTDLSANTPGALLIAGACLCWALDNNLTRKVSASDAVQIAAIKGLVAGTVNLAIAWWWYRLPIPPATALAFAAVVGFCGYGLSLVFFVLALRHLGTARTGAYFSAAPFVGSLLSIAMLGERPGEGFWIAAALMAAGVWLHLTERHEHAHFHPQLRHAHTHTHDEHHQHTHDFAWDGSEPHAHPHEHEPMTHRHLHFPDIHHRHEH